MARLDARGLSHRRVEPSLRTGAEPSRRRMFPALDVKGPTMAQTDTGTWTGFLVVAFGVVGLVGGFSTYAAQLPFDRALARSQALDAVVAASHAPAPKAATDALRPLLGDSADRVLSGPGTMEARADAERRRMLEDLHAESQDYGLRLRVVIAAFTGAAALFGAMVLSIVRRA